MKDAPASAAVVPESQYPRYDSPLIMDGDAAIFPDIEAPFHNAEFINRVIDLSQAWGITQAILAGDFLHEAWASGYDKNWKNRPKGGLDEEQEKRVRDFMNGLGAKQREAGLGLMEQIGLMEPADDYSDEIAAARGVFKSFAHAYEKFDLVLGNHEGRFLRIVQTPLCPEELKVQLMLHDTKWRIAPYYYSHLETEAGLYQIEHPRSAAESTPCRLADKFECHVLMAHSHDWSMRRSTSGRYWAIAMGCCVDEYRLPYASQRHSTSKAHLLGAVIVRGGYPYLLCEATDWERMKRL